MTRLLRSITGELYKAQGQVSSGLRVGDASDNAAYWSIATTMSGDRGAIETVRAMFARNAYLGPEGPGLREPGRNVAQKAGLNRSMLDVAPGETRAQIEYKMRRSGGGVHYVNPAYTSQRCHECGHVDAGNRPTRNDFLCLSCGHAACADHNASRNILQLGRKARTGGLPGVACGSNPVAGRKQEEDGSSRDAQAA